MILKFRTLPIIALLLFSFVFSSCHKDPNDLINGDWKLIYYTVDITDSLQILNSYFGNECILSIDIPPKKQDLNGGGIIISWGVVNESANWYSTGGHIS
ncbi:MAG: hypothetical protein LH473_10675 [Chitinophagales bacterium]|nr:hypothetical protein [Chitinophagales bacterium]